VLLDLRDITLLLVLFGVGGVFPRQESLPVCTFLCMVHISLYILFTFGFVNAQLFLLMILRIPGSGSWRRSECHCFRYAALQLTS